MFDSHIPCRAPAVLWPCRFASAFPRPGHSTAGAPHGMCELTSSVCRRPVADLPSFDFFRLPRGVSRLAVRTWHCWITAKAQHGMCELARLGVVGARHGMCVKLLLSSPNTCKSLSLVLPNGLVLWLAGEVMNHPSYSPDVEPSDLCVAFVSKKEYRSFCKRLITKWF